MGAEGLRRRRCDEHADPSFVEGAWLRQIRPTLARIAASDLPVLLLGETGSGKEILADLVHRLSPRSDRPLLRLSCAAFPEALIEGELFGHERGAFTGAISSKPGLLELASGGTAFLDEVGELVPAVQAKLLRAVGEGRLFRLGDTEERSVDIRYVAATSRDLTGDGGHRFRKDLLYRLNACTVRVPPLRERRDEIEALARFFAARIAARLKRPEPVLSRSALELLLHHDWPGNVRELRNTIEHATILCDGIVQAGHLPSTIGKMAAAPPRARKGAHREDVVEALARTRGNQTRAARLLGVSRQTLIQRIRLYGLPRPRKGSVAQEG